MVRKRVATWSFGGGARWSSRAQWKNATASSFSGARRKRAPALSFSKATRSFDRAGRKRLRNRLEEWRKRGQPHGCLAEVHGGLAELNGRGRLHCRLVELGERGRPLRCLAKLHGCLTELGGRRCVVV
ncbi:unnamed protein product [Sphagnum jensenii]|uniref:Uncharacterized protein n=1 Tax=Sphagnum jensenii TaxID=128206 RepID=A0ABP0XBE7_9BRYO